MSDTDLHLGFHPEEHAPDPIISHGDPIPAGKLAIWLFLATEVMFFIGLLGTYIVLRSGNPRMFEAQGATLNKKLAAVNTLVLIFSSLTMALAVDAAQKKNRSRAIAMLGITIVMAFCFMGIKYVEYSDKFHHYTLLTKDDSPITVHGSEANGKMYVVIRNDKKQPFNGTSFEAAKPANWKNYAIPLSGQYGTFTATIPRGAAGSPTVEIYTQAGDAPASTDKKAPSDVTYDWNGGFWIYDGHLVDELVTTSTASFPRGGTLAVKPGTRFIRLKNKVGDFPADTPAAVLETLSGGDLKVQIDDKSAGKDPITIKAEDVGEDVEAKSIVPKTWTLEHVHRRLVPKTEEINVHIYTVPGDLHSHAALAETAAKGAEHGKGGELASAAPAHDQEDEHKQYTVQFSDVNDWSWYGPQKNIFFSSYFALTGIHGLHVIGGIVPLSLLLAQAIRGKLYAGATEYVGLYWHFVDVVWIFLFPLLYLI